MITNNFWGYIVEGLLSVFRWVLQMLPPGEVNPLLATGATVFYFAIAPLLILVGSFVNLKLLMMALSLVLSMEISRVILAPVRLIMKLIPFMK